MTKSTDPLLLAIQWVIFALNLPVPDVEWALKECRRAEAMVRERNEDD